MHSAILPVALLLLSICCFSSSFRIHPNAAHKVQKIGVQGAPLQKGQPKPGVENGPDLIRCSEIVKYLRDHGHDIVDYGNADLGPDVNAASVGANVDINNPEAVGIATFLLAQSTKDILGNNRFPLTLGGDHAIAIGTMHAMSEKYPDLAVIYIDAHADINTVETTYSGNLHGMPLSFVINELNPINANLTPFSWVVPRIPARNVAHIALRDVDDGEAETLDRLGMAAFSMRDVDRLGILGVLEQVLTRIGGRERPVYISMDIDSLDDMEIGTTTGTPVPGGLTLREVLTMFEEIHRSVNLVGFELAEVNPALGDEKAGERTAKVARHILACVFGHCRGIWP